MRLSESERQFCLLVPWHSWYKQRRLQELLDIIIPPSWKRSVPSDLRDFFWLCVLSLYNRNKGREQLYLFKHILSSDTHTQWCVSSGIVSFLMIYAMVADNSEEFSCGRRENRWARVLFSPSRRSHMETVHRSCWKENPELLELLGLESLPDVFTEIKLSQGSRSQLCSLWSRHC